MSDIRIVKRKIKGFFHTKDLGKVRQVVHDVHKIVSNASILVRAYTIKTFHEKNKLPTIDHDLFNIACRIVQGNKTSGFRNTEKRDKEKLLKFKEKQEQEKQETNSKEKKKIVDEEFFRDIQEKKNAKQTMFNEMITLYKDIYSTIDEKHRFCVSDYSLSHILNYSIKNLLTAYKNNIEMHFCKYPKRYIICDLVSKGFDIKNARKESSRILSFFMFDEGTVLDNEKDLYSDLFPIRIYPDKPRCYEVKENYMNFLYKMIKINCSLETSFLDVKPKYRKLLNPLPFHSSFVPMSIRIDTSALCQLLMSKQTIEEFKKYYSILHPKENPLNIKTKEDLLSSFATIHGRKAISKEEEGEYATELWSFLTNLKRCRRNKELYMEMKRSKDDNVVQWVFDNAVVTDGTSISFQVIDKKSFGRKVL